MITFKVVVSKEVVTVSRPATSTVADLKADISAQTGEWQQLPSLLAIAMSRRQHSRPDGLRQPPCTWIWCTAIGALLPWLSR